MTILLLGAFATGQRAAVTRTELRDENRLEAEKPQVPLAPVSRVLDPARVMYRAPERLDLAPVNVQFAPAPVEKTDMARPDIEN